MMNVPRSVKKLGQIWSVPVECFNTDQELKAIQKGQAAADEEASDLNEAAAQASIAKDMAAAQNSQGSTTRML